MTQKSIIIIGAGMAGLCTGIYAQMNGYRTRIFEKHKIPGGLVTAFRRKGFLVDLCVHWIVGTGPGVHLYRYWNEIGLLEGREILQHDRYGVYHGRDGRVVNLYCDPDRLEKHLLELSPQDAPAIHELADGVRFGIHFKTPEKEKYEASPSGWIKFIFSMMPLLKEMKKWTKMTVSELAGKFQDPLLRDALTTLWIADSSAFFILTTLGWMYKKQAGYPMGGSLPLALSLEKRFKQLGGKVQYQAGVEKILVEEGRAVGVRLMDGSEQRADVVISAADGYATIFKLLEGKYADRKIRDIYDHWKPSQALIYVSAGVDRDFPDIPYSVEGNAFELEKPIRIAGKEQRMVGVRVHNQDTHFAPKGKTVLTSAIFTDYEYWQALHEDHDAYEAEKEKIASAVIEAYEQIWPGISGKVKMTNVATPLTFVRITGNWKASFTGWKTTPEQGMATISKTLPGLKNFWMVGQWVCPGGGLPSGVITGREVVWRQCQQDKKPFLIHPGIIR